MHTEIVCDQVEGLVVVGNFGVQTGEVEAVENIFLLDFTEVLIALRREEPRDPLRSIEPQDSSGVMGMLLPS